MSRFLVSAAALLLVGCASTPTVEEVNATRARYASDCQTKGYKPGTEDYQTCLSLAPQADAQKAANTQMGVGAGLGAASILLMAGSAFSDIRLKHNIIPVDQLDNGIHLYRFQYNWSDQEYVGVMAQEVEHIVPGAVMRGNDGYLRVNYERLGLQLMTLQEWKLSSR